MSKRTRALAARVLVLSMAASASVVASSTVAANAAVTSATAATATAVEVITTDPDNSVELAADVQFALATAMARAEAQPADFAPPYVDPATSKVYAPTIHETSADAETPIVVDYATMPDEGTDIADEPEDAPPPGEQAPAAKPARIAAAATLPTTGTRTFYPVVRQAKYSQTSLEATADAAIAANVPSKDNIVATYLEEDRNRVIVEANAVTEDMRTALADLYGADKVAIYLAPQSTRPSLASRNNDSNPFKGGSATLDCTNGFGWNDGSTEYMLTAGHCVSPGQRWLMPNGARIGDSTRYDTFNDSGSTTWPGNSYPGDVALIDMYGANTTVGQIYTGNKTSNASRDVARAELAYKNKKYCTGGRNRGALCGWKIDKIAMRVNYSGGMVGRNLFRGKKKGWCLWGGDSGGSVYTTQSSNGKIVAKGIISGTVDTGGNDHYAGDSDANCQGFFSEVVRAEKAFPGAITKRP